MAKQKRGRPPTIEEPTVVTTYNVTEKQKTFLQQNAEILGISASDVLREILQREMKRAKT